MLKKSIPSVILFTLLGQAIAQQPVDTTGTGGIGQLTAKDTLPEGWYTSGVFQLNLTQVQLVNWAAGGFSSVSGISMFNGQANWHRGRKAWDSNLVLAFGGVRQDGGVSQKTEDRIEITSKYGYRLTHPFYVAGLVQFRTQFTEGFDDEGRRISHFMAPAYLLGGLGIDHRPSDRFTLYVSPATARMIIVQDETLWDVSDDPEYRVYGVPRGETTELQFGAFLRLQYTVGIAENITFTTRGDLMSNYLRNPQNLVVNWETLWGFKVNDWFGASLNTLLIYDHDVMLPRTDAEGNVTTGPATQFKQTLGVGITVNL